MERLTKRLYDGSAWFNHTAQHGVTQEELLEHLARYEETAILPGEVREMIPLRKACVEIFDHTGHDMNWILSVLEAAKDRRVVLLPKDKVGREMYLMAIKSAQAALDKMAGKDVR